jgi:hypothetical protein
MKYSLTPERAAKLVESFLGPFEIRNKIDDSWKGKFWKLSSGAPQRQVVVWDKDGEALFSFDRNYDELTISTKHFDKIISYIPLDPNVLQLILTVLFKNLLDYKFPVKRLSMLDISWTDKYYLENPFDEDEN